MNCWFQNDEENKLNTVSSLDISLHSKPAQSKSFRLLYWECTLSIPARTLTELRIITIFFRRSRKKLVYYTKLIKKYLPWCLLFPRVKRPGRGVNLPPPSSVEVKERVALYLYSPSGPSRRVLERILSYFTFSTITSVDVIQGGSNVTRTDCV
jgi:hypothetical protein